MMYYLKVIFEFYGYKDYKKIKKFFIVLRKVFVVVIVVFLYIFILMLLF